VEEATSYERAENPGRDQTGPDWRVFADATCAGLAVLIPVPIVDLMFEVTFRRRIPGTIANLRGASLAPEVRRRLGQAVSGPLSVAGCMSLGAKAGWYVVKRIWRKIIYVLAVKDAVTALTEYWHRAFLIDHMVRAGHLDRGVNTDLAIGVFSRVVREIDPSPLRGAARQTVANVQHVVRLLVDARRLGATVVTRSIADLLGSHWRTAERSLHETTERYDSLYRLESARIADQRGVLKPER
jgi:hypothetical protein